MDDTPLGTFRNALVSLLSVMGFMFGYSYYFRPFIVIWFIVAILVFSWFKKYNRENSVHQRLNPHAISLLKSGIRLPAVISFIAGILTGIILYSIGGLLLYFLFCFLIIFILGKRVEHLEQVMICFTAYLETLPRLR